MATLYISPTGSGKKDGSSWANAATLDHLSSLITKAGPGGTVLLAADQGTYTVAQPVAITAGGVAGAPVKIMGVNADGTPAEAQIVGSRMAVYTPGGAAGNEIFRVLGGGNHLDFSELRFTNVGAAFRVGADVSDISVHNVDASNVQRFFDDLVSGTAKTATITGLDLEAISIQGFSKDAIRLQYDTSGVVINQVVGDSQRQDGDNFAEGVHLEGTAHQVLIQNTTMMNATDTKDSYWNGDGFATEAGVYGVRFENDAATGNTDAGFDIKSSSTVLDNVTATDNNRNIRVWAKDTIIENSVATAPDYRGGIGGSAEVWFAQGAAATLVNTVLDNGNSKYAALDISEGGVTATLQGVTLTTAAGVKTATGGANSHVVQVSSQPIQSVPTVAVTASGAAVKEGDSGSTPVTFTLTRSGDLSQVSDVDWNVAGAGAHPTNGTDFHGGALPSGTVEFAAGQVTQTVTVLVSGDKTAEPSESFQLVALATKNAAIASQAAPVTIVNDDSPSVAITSGASPTKGGGVFTFTVTRTGDLSGASSVAYSVSSDQADASEFLNGKMPSGQIMFEAGDVTKTITIAVPNAHASSDEVFSVKIASLLNATLSIVSASSTIEALPYGPTPFSQTMNAVGFATATQISEPNAKANVAIASSSAPGHTYYVDNTISHGIQNLTSFGSSDLIETKVAIYDGNKDGVVTFGADHILHANGPTDILDGIRLPEIDGSKGVRLIGEDASGLYVYGDATVRPTGAIEGTLGDAALNGAGDGRAQDVFFFDTALGLSSQGESISHFGLDDLIVTTTALAGANGATVTAANGGFGLAGGGALTILDPSGVSLGSLTLEGSLQHDGVTYYAYGAVGSVAHLSDLHFG